MFRLVFLLLLGMHTISFAQSDSLDVEQLKREILLLQADVENIQINLVQSQDKFKRGIIVATIGYTVTIAGGLMLGRKYDDLGKVLLVSGGITGITGTFMMADAFKYLRKAASDNESNRLIINNSRIPKETTNPAHTMREGY